MNRSPLPLLTACLVLSACQAPAAAPPTDASAAPGAAPAPGAAASSGPGLIGRIAKRLRDHDRDGDGLADAVELLLGSNPDGREPDADRDRIPDRIEALLGTKADRADSDGDGFSDLFERFESHHAVRDKLRGLIKGRLADWLGFGLLQAAATATDYDGDGIASALDADDDNNGIPDADEDADLDGVPNGIERSGYYPEKGTAVFKAWNGDRAQTYYKTDPMQWSTDADPYGDGMEASGKNMDAAVPFPGNHPLVPAIPELRVALSGYNISTYATISNASNAAIASSWSQSTLDETVTESDSQKSINASASYSTTKGVKVHADAHASTHDETTNTNRVETDASTSSSSAWSSATTTDTAKAGKLSVTLKYNNVGTAPAYEIVPTINLTTGGQVFTFTVDKISSLGSGLAQKTLTFTYPQAGSATTMNLSLDELSRLQTGTPLVTEVADMTAKVFTSIGGSLTDAEQVAQRSTYLGSSDWSTYQQGVLQRSFEAFHDTGDGKAGKFRVYAPPFYNPGLSSDPPEVTIADACAWVYAAKEADDGTLNLSIWDPLTGRIKVQNNAGWTYFLDEDTFDGLSAYNDIMALPLYAGARVSIKSKPDAAHATKVRFAAQSRANRTLELGAYAYYAPKTVVVRPSSGSATTGVTLSEVPNTQGTRWKATSTSYLDIRPTGTEVIEVVDAAAQKSTAALPAVTEGAVATTARPALASNKAALDLKVGAGTFNVAWSEAGGNWYCTVTGANGATFLRYKGGGGDDLGPAYDTFNGTTYASAGGVGGQITGTTATQVVGPGTDDKYVVMLVHQGQYLAKVLITRKELRMATWDMGF